MVLVDVGQLFRCAGQQSPPPSPMPMDPHANGPPMPMPPPPRDFFTKSHTNRPFWPSFLSVQWHVMGTILGVMFLVFNTDFHFSSVPSPVWSRLRLSGRSCLHFVKPSTWPCWPEPMCTIACFRGTKVSGLRNGLHDGSWSKCLNPTRPCFPLLPFTPMPDCVMHQLHLVRTNG